MRSKNRIYSYISLGLSLLSLISFLVVTLIRGLLKSNIIQIGEPAVLDKSLWSIIGVFILGLASAALSDPAATRNFIFGKKLVHGSNSAIILLGSIGILVFINIIVFQNPKSWDITENKANTLSPETKTLISTLTSKISATAYFSSQSDETQARKILENFTEENPKYFSYTFVDPETNPLLAQNDGVTQDGTIILHMGLGKEPITFFGEEEIDIAIIKLINPTKTVIYFSTGHGEADLAGAEDTSFSLVKTGLENKNYEVKSINLGKIIPEDANVLVIAGPQTGFSEIETENLEKFQDNGGALIILDNPLMLGNVGSMPATLDKILKRWGINEQDDIIYDPKANPPLLVYADPANYGEHLITNKMRGFNSRFFTAHSFSFSETDQITITPLVQTYPEAWGETNRSSIENSQVAFDKTSDFAGPLVLAIAGENLKNNSRIVIFGDSDFAANGLYKQGYGLLLLNSIDWACKQEKLISLTPKSSTARTYNPPGTASLILIIISSLCFLPLTILFAGIYAWIRRRKMG